MTSALELICTLFQFIVKMYIFFFHSSASLVYDASDNTDMIKFERKKERKKEKERAREKERER